MAIVISAYPGIGKTYTCLKYNSLHKKDIGFVDSDSSEYHYVDKDTKEVNSLWPQNYIDEIRSQLKDPKIDIIFVSTHREVRDVLSDAGIPVIVVYPSLRLKKEIYCERFLNRKTGLSGKAFYTLMLDKWDEFHKHLNKKHDNEVHIDILANYMDLQEVFLRALNTYKNRYSYTLSQAYFHHNSNYKAKIKTNYWCITQICEILDKIYD